MKRVNKLLGWAYWKSFSMTSQPSGPSSLSVTMKIFPFGVYTVDLECRSTIQGTASDSVGMESSIFDSENDLVLSGSIIISDYKVEEEKPWSEYLSNGRQTHQMSLRL